MSELKHLKNEWKAIFSCMGCGDCGYAIRPAVDRYLTCPVLEAKGEGGFEIYFARGRMNVLKSILEGQIPLPESSQNSFTSVWNAEIAQKCVICLKTSISFLIHLNGSTM